MNIQNTDDKQSPARIHSSTHSWLRCRVLVSGRQNQLGNLFMFHDIVNKKSAILAAYYYLEQKPVNRNSVWRLSQRHNYSRVTIKQRTEQRLPPLSVYWWHLDRDFHKDTITVELQ